MTAAEIAKLEAMLEKTTPGEWSVWRHKKTLQIDAGRDTGTNRSAVVHWMGFDHGDRPFSQKIANAALIAAMKNALPELLKAAREGKEDSLLWHWAETNPEKAMGALGMWWNTAGRGCREVRFEFRNIVRAAMKEASK